MRHVELQLLARDSDANAVFDRICDFASYADHTSAVRSVQVVDLGDGGRESAWSVNFRNGVLCWSELDRIDGAALRIDFVQTDGDFEHFDGSWRIAQIGPDVRVTFAATFDLGMPSLAALIDPIAEQTLRETIEAILRGMLGSRVALADGAGRPAMAG